jgi:hypothetical protein
MRRLIAIFLCLSLLANGCASRPLNEAGLYQRPGWWERRMDRLEDWNTRHGYVFNKAKTAVIATMFVGGSIAAVVGCLLINGERNKRSGSKSPCNDSGFTVDFN